jgi:hypothetical protein
VIAAIVAAGRREAERLMTDRCTITYVTGQVTDPLTGQVTPQTAVRYSGPCRVQAPSVQGQQADVGQVPVVVLRLQLQLPVAGSELVARGDTAEITSSGDEALIGRRYTVRDLAHKSHATSRRLTIEEIT